MGINFRKLGVLCALPAAALAGYLSGEWRQVTNVPGAYDRAVWEYTEARAVAPMTIREFRAKECAERTARYAACAAEIRASWKDKPGQLLLTTVEDTIDLECGCELKSLIAFPRNDLPTIAAGAFAAMKVLWRFVVYTVLGGLIGYWAVSRLRRLSSWITT